MLVLDLSGLHLRFYVQFWRHHGNQKCHTLRWQCKVGTTILKGNLAIEEKKNLKSYYIYGFFLKIKNLLCYRQSLQHFVKMPFSHIRYFLFENKLIYLRESKNKRERENPCLPLDGWAQALEPSLLFSQIHQQELDQLELMPIWNIGDADSLCHHIGSYV